MNDDFYFPHNYNASGDLKLRRVFCSLGCEGIGIYWLLVETLYQAGGKIELKYIPDMAQEYRISLEKFESLLKDFDLFVQNHEFFWSEGVTTRLKHINTKRRKARASARLSHSANAQRTLSESSAIKKEKKEKKEKNNNIVEQIISYLNNKCHKNFSCNTKATNVHIMARLSEGRTIDDFKKVIDTKCGKWLDDPKMIDFLRPDTLFGNKFESYLNEPPPHPLQGKVSDVSMKNFDTINSWRPPR